MEKDELLEFLETRLRDNPKSLLFARLADLYLNRGNPDDALVLCTEGVRHHPYYTTGYFLLARTHVLRKEYDKAEAALKKVLSHDQQYLSAQKLLGDILVKTGWEAAASEHYASVIEADPMEDKIRDLVKRYAVQVDRPKREPVAAPELPPAPEPEPEAEPELSFLPEPESGLPVQAMEPVPPGDFPAALPSVEMESDWTDQIREFSPEDIDLPVPKSAGRPDHPLPPDHRMTDSEIGETAAESISAETNSGKAVGSPRPDPDETPESSGWTDPPAAASREPAKSAEEVVDFTQNWFDLSSFDNPEEEKTGETATEVKESDLELEIFDVETPGPEDGTADDTQTPQPRAAALFEKKEPEHFLSPSELEPVRKPPEPEPARPVPWFKAESQSGQKTPPPAPPKPSAQPQFTEAAPARQAEPAPPPKTEERADQKIVTSTLGEIYAAQGQFEKAIEVYQALIEKSPNESRYTEKIADLKKRLKESSGK